MRPHHGFTLLEMIVVLAIAALIIGVGAASLAGLTEEHELSKATVAVEQIFMTAVHRAGATSSAQVVAFDDTGLALIGSETGQPSANRTVTLPKGTRLLVRRFGADKLVPAAGQRVLMRPHGLCEPLQLQLERQGATVTASLDPLTGGLVDVEEHFSR